jgi:hypothetical protein
VESAVTRRIPTRRAVAIAAPAASTWDRPGLRLAVTLIASAVWIGGYGLLTAKALHLM